MIAVDTNVVVRLLTRDDDAQFRKASAIFEKFDVLIPESVILESVWVLQHAYGFDIGTTCDAIAKTLGLPNVKLQRPAIVAEALELTRKGLDFADALHLAQCQECTEIFTFDAAFVRRSKGLTKCKVKQP